jgi:putative nucleotidyltransferase with HDIG domain
MLQFDKTATQRIPAGFGRPNRRAGIEPPMTNAHNGKALNSHMPEVESVNPPVPCCELRDSLGGRPVPSDEECLAMCRAYAMPEHILRHSQAVAAVAACLAELAVRAGVDADVQSVRACALLHDLAKGYTIVHGGHHGQLGGAWVMALTNNPLIAQGVIHHVYWPFEMDVRKHFLPLAVSYADKRVQHDAVVTMASRFDDLIARYGDTTVIRGRIRATMEQALELERKLQELLEVDLNACSFDHGGLVRGA